MKKMMIALAGIVSVMLLASCQKEVKIDGDVSLEQPTNYNYRLKVNGTVRKSVYKLEAIKNGSGKTWNYDKEKSEEYTVNNWKGNVTWENDPDSKSNVKKYDLTITDAKQEFPTKMTIEYYDNEYGVGEEGFFDWSYSAGYYAEKHNTITNPEESTFDVGVSYSTKDDDREYNIGDTYTTYKYSLKFTR